MEILDKITLLGFTISVGDRFSLNNEATIVVKELFKIDDVPYLTTILEGHAMPQMKIRDTEEVFNVSRIFAPLEFWIKVNGRLLDDKKNINQ